MSDTEHPLHDYIDMDVYDVVAGQTYRHLLEQLEAVESALRGLVDALTVDEDGELIGGPESWGPAWVQAVEVLASSPTSRQEEA